MRLNKKVVLASLFVDLIISSTTFLQVTEPESLSTIQVDFSVAQFGHLPRSI